MENTIIFLSGNMVISNVERVNRIICQSDK
jgi:hypothetical protein